jgi:DNA primase
MREWLEHALASFDLPGNAEGWCLGRGLQESRLRDLGVCVWDTSKLTEPCTDATFKKEFGTNGSKLNGRLIIPVWSPRGGLLGFEARSWGLGVAKSIHQYRLPEAFWNPVFLGMTRNTMQKIADGGAVWICEGVFDMGALDHVIPTTDVALGACTAKLSDRQLLFCKRFVSSVYLVFDNDVQGRFATFGGIDPKTGRKRQGAMDKLNWVGVPVRDVAYRGGKDPGEIWDRGGVEGLRKAFLQQQ